MSDDLSPFNLGRHASVDSKLQSKLETTDAALRTKFEMTAQQTAVGVVDLRHTRLAMLRPDRLFYGASVPKIVTLAAYFELKPDATADLAPEVRRELGLMIKKSSNEMAAKYSQMLGLSAIRRVVEKYALYDDAGGGGLWLGKHYGVTGERVGDPIGDHSHAATVRQLLRFYLLLEQGKLVSTQACAAMIDIFKSPTIPHEVNKFVAGLQEKQRVILRKSGSWENWLHDTAIVEGATCRYILAALTEHSKGDEYLVELARSVDDLMQD